ncbi:class A beta-lactamase [Mycolicibacterium mengxianglii]|uniref:class A beta-lactamase n=1 Tax=Mycolicibacterium mengxianglii TaxID=2736649 RepID=UPI0018EF0661|nr:class A beta-lactamase [Mycolicibacterium mengxianglii]
MVTLSRRELLTAGLAFTALASVGGPIAHAQPGTPVDQRLAELERQHGAVIGVFAVDLQSGRTVTHRDTERFAMCSSFKTYAAGRILQKAERGELALTDTVVVNAADLLPNSPITETRVGQTITVAELCAAALQRSDNAAANYLLRAIGGPQAVTDFARSIGDNETRLDRWETELNSAVPGDLRDTSTPAALGNGYRDVLTGAVLGDAGRTQLVDWMTANATSSLRPGLPPGWVLADKTGSGDYGSTNDVGVGFGPDGRNIVLSVMIRSAGDDPDAEGFRPIMAEIAGLVMPALSAQG